VAAIEELVTEPDIAAGHHDMSGLRLDLLRRAAEAYLRLAYPSGVVPDAVRHRLTWRECSTPAQLLSGPPFERVGKTPGRPAPIYALRLGNYRYPHMKLQIQPWPNEAGFMISVNTHDQVAGLDLSAVDALAFRELQAENQRLKEAIEHAWDEAGLPTFLRYLRDYIKSRSGDAGAAKFDEKPGTTPGATDSTPLA
jgi:hypothetical protein